MQNEGDCLFVNFFEAHSFARECENAEHSLSEHTHVLELERKFSADLFLILLECFIQAWEIN